MTWRILILFVFYDRSLCNLLSSVPTYNGHCFPLVATHHEVSLDLLNKWCVWVVLYLISRYMRPEGHGSDGFSTWPNPVPNHSGSY